MDFDYAIIGSGPAGTHAAYGLRGLRTLVIDTGFKPESWNYDSIDNLRSKKSDIVEELLGNKFESLQNLGTEYLSPKLKGPALQYITNKPSSISSATESLGFLSSYAQGGLGNAWGGGVYRFNDNELLNFPYSAKELAPYYDELNELIGIQGERDDLSFTCGEEQELLKPFAFTPLADRLVHAYRRHRKSINEKGFYVGRPRLAVLSHEYNGREPYGFFGDDFFAPRLRGLYSPYYTLQNLIQRNEITYADGWVVNAYSEGEHGVSIFCSAVHGKEVKVFTAKKLLLGTGALNTAKIVLNSNKDYDTRLPLIENPISFIPTVSVYDLGKRPDHKNRIGGEALLCHRADNGDVTYAAFYGLQGPLRSDLWMELPFTVNGRIAALKYLVPSMAIFQVFHKGYKSNENFVRLDSNGNLSIRFDDYHSNRKLEKAIVGIVRKLGFLTHHTLIKSPIAGSSIHYAGPLGMDENGSSKYSTDANGKLWNSKNVYVIDSSAFPSLPSKNLTYTIMAHALRVARRLRMVNS
jgi:choline dehydrogenase-like flavoprotein